jgi:transposase
MDWSAKSPDLSPTEHLWDELERRLRSRPQRPTSPLTALATALQEKSVAIPLETFRDLVESLPGRVRAVILAKVRPTRY